MNRQPDPTRPESITSNWESCTCYANWTNENHLNFCAYSQSGVHSTWILVSRKTNAFGGTLVMRPHLPRHTWHSTFTTKEKGQCSLYAVVCYCNSLCSSQPSQYLERFSIIAFLIRLLNCSRSPLLFIIPFPSSRQTPSCFVSFRIRFPLGSCCSPLPLLNIC